MAGEPTYWSLLIGAPTAAQVTLLIGLFGSKSIPIGKLKQSISLELAGTGAPLAFAHGLGQVPSYAYAVVTQGDNGAGAAGTQFPNPVVTADATNVNVNAPIGSKFIVICGVNS